jgi:hypothetical protein
MRPMIAALAAIMHPAGLEAADMARPSHPPPLPPPLGGNAAAQELAAARRAGTIEAYDLFLARHPADPLARTARRERRSLGERRGRHD